MESVGIFYGRWEYFMAIWYILFTLGLLYGFLVYCCGNLVYSPPLLVYCVKKNLATLGTVSVSGREKSALVLFNYKVVLLCPAKSIGIPIFLSAFCSE
jgi:uncharacterized membrane protein SpoIIM required for sporulation